MFFGVKRGFQYWLSPEAYISGERRLSPAPTCFWHPRLLRSRRAKSAEGMGVRWTALFGLFCLSHFIVETILPYLVSITKDVENVKSSVDHLW